MQVRGGLGGHSPTIPPRADERPRFDVELDAVAVVLDFVQPTLALGRHESSSLGLDVHLWQIRL